MAPATRAQRPLADCITKYLAEVKEHRESKTYAAYSKSLRSFAATTRKTYIEDLTRDDAMTWVAAMRRQGNQPRTMHNRAINLNTFMRHFDLPMLFKRGDKPKYTQKKVRAYNEVDLRKMFSHASEDETDLLYFLLTTGAREQEPFCRRSVHAGTGRGGVLQNGSATSFVTELHSAADA